MRSSKQPSSLFSSLADKNCFTHKFLPLLQLVIDMLLMTDRCVLTSVLHDAWGRSKYMEEKARVQNKVLIRLVF